MENMTQGLGLSFGSYCCCSGPEAVLQEELAQVDVARLQHDLPHLLAELGQHRTHVLPLLPLLLAELLHANHHHDHDHQVIIIVIGAGPVG